MLNFIFGAITVLVVKLFLDFYPIWFELRVEDIEAKRHFKNKKVSTHGK